MTFEEALEAIRQKQGKSAIYKDSNGDDCEIYEEPLKEPEMTAEHAIEILKSARRSYRYIPGIDGAIDFAIEAIEKQNQVEAADDLNNDNESVNVERAQKKYDNVIEGLHILLDFYKDNYSCRTKIKNVIERLERDTEPEHKCNACHCNCSHTVEDADLQEEMKQTLKDKFFELAKEDITQVRADLMLAILQSMCGIYKLLYP